MFVFLHTKTLLRKGQLYKERICSQEGGENSFILDKNSLEKIHIHPDRVASKSVSFALNRTSTFYDKKIFWKQLNKRATPLRQYV